MRLAVVILMGLLAVAAADVSEPKHLTGRLTCVLPIARLQCTRDWRSGFVAGMRYGWDGITGVNTGGGFFQICSPGIQNQTTFDMSRPTGSGGSFGTANSGAPEWYRLTGSTALNAAYLYKAGAPITQVIVLKADNPYGHKFGKIPAIIIVYQDIVNGQQQLKTAVCGNPVYAAAYLSPDTAPAPPTPVSLKAVYNSPLSEHTNSALGSFEAKCSIRGTQFSAYHTGDPWKSSKFFIKNLEHVCFTAANNTAFFPERTPSTPGAIISNDCNSANPCPLQPCHFAGKKEDGKHSTSFSCVAAGTGFATGKYGVIKFNASSSAPAMVMDWDMNEAGQLQRVEKEGFVQPEGDLDEEEH